MRSGFTMPFREFQGNGYNSTIMGIVGVTAPEGGIRRWPRPLRAGERHAGAYIVPDFQRQPGWDLDQRRRFILSVWRGLPTGTLVYNGRTNMSDDPLAGLLLDGQQRTLALEDYVTGAYDVLGHRFPDLPLAEKRSFLMIPMQTIETDLPTVEACMDIYDALAYGGTPHDPEARRTPGP